MRGLEVPGPLQCFPVGLDECLVAADLEIVIAGHQEQRVGIRRGVGIGQALPVHQVGRLRPLVNNLALRALPLDEKIQLVPGELVIAITVHGVQSPQRVTAEVPAEARPGRIPRGIETRYERSLRMRGRGLHAQLVNRHFSPGKCPV